MDISTVWAQTGHSEQPPAFKLSLGHYQFSDRLYGRDFNLRHTSELGNVWIGLFQLPDQNISEWRTGWDRTFGKDIRLTPSLQSASGGFLGASLQAELGDPWFAGFGFGRTNLRPYFNLNFDPNDAILLTLGKRGAARELFMLQYIRDNRDHPDQQHLHLIYRTNVQQDHRLTIDVLYKTGLVENVTISKWGVTIAYDWPRYFVRLAWDPKVNFSSDNAVRFSVGARF
jgi:hypothetical protein